MLKVGKLDSDLLKRIVIDKIKTKRPEVLVHSGVGEDCAVIEIGRLSIHISCNDIASNGIEPVGIMLAVMLPEGTTEADVENIMAQAAEAAKDCNVEIIGGHTEITKAVNQPVIVSTAIGRGKKWQSASAEKIQVGDAVLMTKAAGIEGTGIIAGDYEEELKDFLTAEEISRAKELLKDVSVVREGITAGKIGTHGMHDVTEGGILGAVWEMCQIAHVGVRLEEAKIPVEEVTKKISEHFEINYLRLISSGSMIIVAPADKKDAILEELNAAGVPAARIGEIVPESQGLKLIREADGSEQIIDPPEADELYKVVK